MAGRVEGKVAFITGAARGQGRSHAVRLAQEGADIIAVDICGPVSTNTQVEPASSDDLAETADLVKQLNRRIVTAEVDVRDYDAVKAAADSGVEQLGRLDIVCANAGIGNGGLTLDRTSETDWTDMIDVNLSGAWKTVKAAVPHLISQGDSGAVERNANPALSAPSPMAIAAAAAKRTVRQPNQCARVGLDGRQQPPS